MHKGTLRYIKYINGKLSYCITEYSIILSLPLKFNNVVREYALTDTAALVGEAAALVDEAAVVADSSSDDCRRHDVVASHNGAPVSHGHGSVHQPRLGVGFWFRLGGGCWLRLGLRFGLRSRGREAEEDQQGKQL